MPVKDQISSANHRAPPIGSIKCRGGKLSPIGKLFNALGLKMNQSGSAGCFWPDGRFKTEAWAKPATASRGHRGTPALSGKGTRGPLCGDLGGAAVPGDAHKPFSVPKLGRMSFRPGGAAASYRARGQGTRKPQRPGISYRRPLPPWGPADQPRPTPGARGGRGAHGLRR